MSDITDWEPLAGKPLNASDYVLSLQPPTDDSHPETYWQRQYGKALTQLEEVLFEVEDLEDSHHDLLVFADDVATRLNDQLIRLFGDLADWQEQAGSTEIPENIDLKGMDRELIAHLWILREGANGICASNNY